MTETQEQQDAPPEARLTARVLTLRHAYPCVQWAVCPECLDAFGFRKRHRVGRVLYRVAYARARAHGSLRRHIRQMHTTTEAA